MNKALIIIKSPGIGDLQILLTNIHNISKEIGRPVSVLAQKNTGAKAVFLHDKKHVNEVIDLGRKDFFNIINKIKSRKFDQCYIYSDSIRLWLIAKLSNLDPFRGKARDSAFSIVKWIAKNPQQTVFYEAKAPFEGDIGTLDQVPIPPCLDKAMRHENPRHHVRVALVQHLADNLRWFAHPSTLTAKEKSDIADKIADFIGTLGWRDYNPHTSRFHINSLMDYEQVTSCAKLQARDLCTGPCWRDDGTRRG